MASCFVYQLSCPHCNYYKFLFWRVKCSQPSAMNLKQNKNQLQNQIKINITKAEEVEHHLWLDVRQLQASKIH